MNYPIYISSDSDDDEFQDPIWIPDETRDDDKVQEPIWIQDDETSDDDEVHQEPIWLQDDETSDDDDEVQEPIRQQDEVQEPTINYERLIYEAALQDLNQPKTEKDLPHGVLSVPLMRHQKIALEWMSQKERSLNNCLGGILADDQGLGKTISTIALILLQNLKSQSKSKKSRSGRSGGTLIVCPTSVVKQWAKELYDKVSLQHKLSVLVYHGSNRTNDPLELAKYDVVVTTYALVTNEVPQNPQKDSNDGKSKRGRFSGALAKVRWLRVVLDEAQIIKNHKTQVARACSSLNAERRWCLSGTPIQNEILDLFSYFKFLRYHPYAELNSFRNKITVPITEDKLKGYKKLQAILRAILLRRTKGTLLDGQPILHLPPKIVNLTKLDFSPEELSFYCTLEGSSQSEFKAFAAAGTVNQNYAYILVLLLQLRQACGHPILVRTAKDVDGLYKEHLLVRQSDYKSTKIKAVIETLESLAKQGSANSLPIKTLVFSQWTGMLDLLEHNLVKNRITFRRLDGSMSLLTRDKAVKEFSNDPTVQVMLMSLKAGNLGLNMVSACHVILLDLWWNPATEDQAIDRAHRIGQTQTVSVSRITIKGTVEERILALQEKKRIVVASALGEDPGELSATRLTVEDLSYLFGVSRMV